MKVAKAEPGTVIRHPYGGKSHTFEFGDDGTRQVTQEEENALLNYEKVTGRKVEIVEQKKGGK